MAEKKNFFWELMLIDALLTEEGIHGYSLYELYPDDEYEDEENPSINPS